MPSNQAKAGKRNDPKKQLRKIRALWRRTEAGQGEVLRRPKMPIEDEVDTYFNATLFNAHLRIDEVEENNSSRKPRTATKKLRTELKLIGELGEFIITTMKGFYKKL